MSNALVKFSVPNSDEMESIKAFCDIAVESGRYKKMMEVGGKSSILLTLLMAKEFDMKPLVALNGGLNNIDGRVEMSSGAILTKIRDAGHSLQVEYKLDPQEGLMCCLTGRRKDNGDTTTITYSMADAKIAGLDRRGPWIKYPKDMLLARAASRIGRFLFPDVIGGVVYSEGEISESMQEADFEEIKKPSKVTVQQIPLQTTKIPEAKSLSDEILSIRNEIFMKNEDLEEKYSKNEILVEYIEECAQNAGTTFAKMHDNMVSKKQKFEERFVLWLRDRFYRITDEDIVNSDIAKDEIAM